MKKVKDLFMWVLVRLLAPVWFIWGMLIGIVGTLKGMTIEEAIETYVHSVINWTSRN